MRVFVTGGSGWIGSALVPTLLSHGHQVTALARSDASAEALAAAGAEVVRGDLDSLDVLRAQAAAADGVIHLAYVHDFTKMDEAAATDRAAIGVYADELAGTDKPLLIASGVLGLASGRTATEDDAPKLGPDAHPRLVNAVTVKALAERGVRSAVVRLAPTVHGEGDHGFVAELVRIAREKGVSGYIGDGANRWPAVHVSDAAELFRLGLESAPAGSVLHGVAEEGVPVREIAETVGTLLGIPTVSVAPEAAAGHFGWLATFLGLDVATSHEITSKLVGWTPTGPTLLEDLPHYTR